jgi:cell division protein FtsN
MNEELQRGTPLRQMIAAAGNSRPEVQIASAEMEPEPMEPETIAYAVLNGGEPVPDSINEEFYYVQVGSFADPGNAEKARSELASAWPVQVVELSSGGEPIYRVRLGPLAGRPDADTAVDDAVHFGHADAHLIVAHSMQAAL